MQNPYDVRPRQTNGDKAPMEIYMGVGAALNAWETLESNLAELFDALVSKAPSNRAAFSAFISVTASSARTELLQHAAPKALKNEPLLRDDVSAFITQVSKFGSRRNELAHGRTFNLGEYGWYLCPNNTNRNKWDQKGAAKYQYVSSDIAYYAEQFAILAAKCTHLTEAVKDRHAAQKQHEERLQQRRSKTRRES